MASRAVKVINSGYQLRYKRKASKGLGIYALAPPGMSSNSTHLSVRKGEIALCRCGGCTGGTRA